MPPHITRTINGLPPTHPLYPPPPKNPQDVGDDEIAEAKGSDNDDALDADEQAPLSEEKKDDLLDAPSGEYKLKAHGVIESKFLMSAAEDADSKDAPGAGGAPISKAFTPQPVRWDSDDEDEKQVQENEIASSDPLHGKRVHCWVLVRGGKRGVPEMLFVEPSTARIYPVSESPYQGIEAVWNAKNYWVNMQTEKDLVSHSYDFGNNDLWEFVFIDNGPIALVEKEQGERSMMDMLNDPIVDEEKEANEEEEEEKEGVEDEEVDDILDIPESWVNKLKIDRSKFNIRYPPYGLKVVLYKKAKLELFAEGFHDQGMVSRLTVFKDVARTVVKESVEKFVNRRDKLMKRIRKPLERMVHESFDPGRPSSLKYLVEWAGKRREMHFYVNARLDGLLCREEDMGKKIVEKFEGRGDNLTYRSIAVKESLESGNSTFVLPGGAHNPDLVVLKMTEKYERNDEKDASEDVAKRTFYVKENKVRTQYHYAKSCITRNTFNYDKERSAEDVGDQLEVVRDAEKECLSEVRRARNETADLITMRKHEELEIIIDQPVFESASSRRDEERKVQEILEEQEQGDKRQLDYLTPFLMSIDPKDLTREDAMKVKENCLKALKDRLLERANIIQNRLNEENKELAKYQAAFQRNQRDNDPDAEEQFEKECSEAMFRIQILEQRLVQHEESALKKYKDMDNKLVVVLVVLVVSAGRMLSNQYR